MIFLSVSRMISRRVLVAAVFLSIAQASPTRPVTFNEVSPASPAIIIGFVGGFVKHDDMVHTEVQIAARLRTEYATRAVVETFENHNGEKAYRQILAVLDANHDGTLSVAEKKNARIILYGHSWGASEVIALARRLDKEGIPVLLTVQVDSVKKNGEDDEFIPANVLQAVNFYQTDGLLRGEPEIRAADASRTRIIGNFRFHYDAGSYNCANYPWYNRMFMKSHTQIECDPKVWNEVESLIRSNLLAAAAAGADASAP
jgi:hypothetical protein